MPPASKYNSAPCNVWPMPVSNLIPSAAAIAPAMAETGARIGNCRFRAVGGRVLFAEIRVHRQYFQPWIQLAQSFCGAFHTWLADSDRSPAKMQAWARINRPIPAAARL